MHHFSRALAALLAAGGAAGVLGCADTTTTGPRGAGPHSTPAARSISRPARLGPRYTGAASDSLVESLAAQWAAAGRPEYRQRQRTARMQRDAVLRSLAPTGGTDGTGGTTTTDTKRQARILTHDTYVVYGGLLNGRVVDSYAVGEMTFEGEVGMIATNFSLYGTGVSYGPAAAELASGGGQLLDCLDVMFSTCLKHRLAGTITLYGAPTCGVTPQGTTSFQAWYAPVQIGISLGGISLGPGSTKEGLATGSQGVLNSAPPCPTKTPVDTTRTPVPADGGFTDAGAETSPPPTTDYPTATYTCYEVYELMKVQQDPYTWYVWQDNGVECEMNATYSRTERMTTGAVGPQLSLAGTPSSPSASATTAAPHGARRVVIAASTSIPNGLHAAYVERAPGEHEDVILVDRARVTVQELAAAATLALSRQNAVRTRDRGFVVTRARSTRYAETNAAVLEQSLHALDTASVTKVPGFGELPNVELVLPPVVRQP